MRDGAMAMHCSSRPLFTHIDSAEPSERIGTWGLTVAEYVVGGSVMFHGSYLKNNKSKHVVDILFCDVADVPNDVAPDHVLGSSSVWVRTR